VTFIVGLKCSDGLVMCADTLESDGYTKKYRNKLVNRVIGSEWGVCWGGSGNAYVVDKFSDKLTQMIGNDSYGRAALEIHAEACLEFIRTQYSRPCDQIDIVLSLFGRPLQIEKGLAPVLGIPEFHLYKGSSESACFASQKEYCCAGMDVTLAEFVLANTYLRSIKMAEATRLGIFTTAMMKKYADGVGGETTVYTHLRGSDQWSTLSDFELSVIESDVSVESAEINMSKFWANSPNRINFSQMTEAEIEVNRLMQPRPRTKN
jgi:20S proteasome alpha/beta subunit